MHSMQSLNTRQSWMIWYASLPTWPSRTRKSKWTSYSSLPSQSFFTQRSSFPWYPFSPFCPSWLTKPRAPDIPSFLFPCTLLFLCNHFTPFTPQCPFTSSCRPQHLLGPFFPLWPTYPSLPANLSSLEPRSTLNSLGSNVTWLLGSPFLLAVPMYPGVPGSPR